MKKIILLLMAAVLSFGLLTCESIESSALGEAAGKLAEAGAEALGASKEAVSSIGQGVKAAVSTFAESKKAADSLTPENEYYLGRAVAANVAGTYTIYRNAALETYLDKICDTIVINSPRPDIYNGYHVAILDTQEINAFATPGGHVFVTRGLISCASNEDALASVIAHEIAHIQKQHALTSIRNARYTNAAISGVLAGVGAAVGTEDAKELAGVMSDSVNEVVTTMVVNGFSKEQEFEADKTALSLLASAGYQPSGILEMLGALQQRQQGGAGFSKTHPSPADRITNVNRSIKEYAVPDTRSFRTSRYAAISR
jgi:predicted Zn-dependent protease